MNAIKPAFKCPVIIQAISLLKKKKTKKLYSCFETEKFRKVNPKLNTDSLM